MKKTYILIILSFIFILLIGCDNTLNSPSIAVKEFLSKYQNLDKSVITALDNSINKLDDLSDKDKSTYKDIIIKQYQNLSYKINNEIINNDNATIDVEIEVLDYHTSIKTSKEYYINHYNEFNEDNNSYIEYKLKELKKVTNKIKYDITFNLIRNDNIWKLNKVNSEDIKKIHGLY